MSGLRYDILDSPVGELLLTDHGAGLSSVKFQRPTALSESSGPTARPEIDRAFQRDPDGFRDVAEALERYFSGDPHDFDLSLDLRGTPFQLIVWSELRRVGPGETVSYGELARRIERPTSVRAVAGAVARNPLAIVIGCHRVIGTDGSLTGFAGGLDRKKFLLRLEGSW